MPPRFAYWTIILEGKPTAFRAHDREELLPTFKQLQSKHPDVAMMWFGRGRLWNSPEEARANDRRGERRTPDWRPGGEHRDPRARFDVPRDEKRRRFAAKLRRDARDGFTPGDQRPPEERTRDRQNRPDWKPQDRQNRPEWKPRDRQQRPDSKPGDRPNRPDWKPGGHRP